MVFDLLFCSGLLGFNIFILKTFLSQQPQSLHVKNPFSKRKGMGMHMGMGGMGFSMPEFSNDPFIPLRIRSNVTDSRSYRKRYTDVFKKEDI